MLGPASQCLSYERRRVVHPFLCSVSAYSCLEGDLTLDWKKHEGFEEETASTSKETLLC